MTRIRRKFGRERNQRRAFIRSLAVALITRGKIKTTEARAKEVRSAVERLITYAKREKSAQANIKEITKFVNKTTAKKLIKDIAPKYTGRAGGYTRIIKIGQRGGDAAHMVFIEFV